MNQAEFRARLAQIKLIASVKEAKYLEKAAEANLSAAVLSIGNIGVIKGYVDFFKSREIPVFLHLERIGGISYDREGIAFLAHYVKPDGIVTTRNTLVKLAKKQGLLTIQRLFLVDSDSLKSGLLSIQDTQPDAVELMPALLPEYIEEFRSMIDTPIIAGGLLRKREQMEVVLQHGATAVSVGSPSLWKESFIHDYSVVI
ncbi:glycerol uptake operon antiterminator [Brevibacillus reuszeri]|uniref:Glycerol uptake operon antiterminator regulatory protein n=1 Tax=Brevibacillus reuszeri TaxID=54915 RepID=A0A0K9YSP2_9BACL|nr:glycerol-3-phosphate responsive antiterminator [Brevibacillus reuszeri]KNB71723.1 transcriptional regulator [Brevibacillus reuszeri]MED1855452.1 glycerol-3-phosphate responsive antiterminator [Brevibacillus reuszeri]GED67399.1 glycerol uptake operon antiterminator [Brevibacillus reuszeri]